MSVPMTWGLRRPVILVPAGSAAWSEATKRSVLLHELGHIRRGDCLMHLLGPAGLRGVLVPSAGLAGGQAVAQDQRAGGRRRGPFLQHRPARLCRASGGHRRLRCAGLHLFGHVALPMASPSDLEGRVLAILDPQRNHRSLKRKTCYALMASRRVALDPCALLRLGYARGTSADVDRSAAAPVAGKGPGAAESASAKVDLYGDPIPAGAAMRLGTIRFRGEGMETHLALSPDGKTLISDHESKISFLETRSGRLLREINLPERNIQAFDVSPDGKTAALATTHFDAQRKDVFFSVAVLELGSGKERAKLEWSRLQGPDCRACRFTPDGATLVIAPGTERSPCGNVAAQQELLKYKFPGGEIEAIDVSPDGKLIAAATLDGVYLWPWLAGDQPVKLPIGAHRGTVIRFSPAGTLLAVGGEAASASTSGISRRPRWSMRSAARKTALILTP